MPVRVKDDTDTEMDDGDDYEEAPSTSKRRGKTTTASNKNKRRVSMLKDTEAQSRSEASADSGDLMANDDFNEKRRRRQSAARAALQPTAEEEGDGPPGSGAQRTPKKTAVARAHQLDRVDHTPLPAVPLDVMSSNFEEWMKMATDNKINAANSWNFALIDYFYDMSLLRNTQDGSVNFQKASYTLDGCVKVWTSRVDSCKNDTGKLLSNLTNDTVEDEEEEGPHDVDADGEEGGRTQAKKKRAHRTENTLAKSVEQLQVKKLETECTPDPLFKKTSADFDEGGAGGMLMNHLSVDAQLQIVFDASESRLLDEEDAETEDAMVSLAELRGKLPALEELDEYAIMAMDFQFNSSDKVLDLAFASNMLASRNTPDEPMDFANGDSEMAGAGEGPVEDFFTGGEAVANFDDNFPGAGGGGFDEDGDDDDGVGGGMDNFTANNATGPNRTGPLEPFDPRRGRDERTLIMSMTEDATDMLDYFDSTVMKNWAGPQHWKVRRVIRKDGDTTGNTTARSRKDKTAFMIDFETPSENTAKKLFVPGTKSALALPAAKAPQGTRKKGGKNVKPVKKNDYLLPNDMHFSSMQLLRLFMKPKFTVQMRRTNVDDPPRGEDDEVDEKFWAQAAADNAAGLNQDDAGGFNPAPFATQFFNDDDDGDDPPGFGDGDIPLEGMATNAEEEDLIAATQGTLKRVRPEHINYTKRAKRVDVRMLKENIWKGLDIVVPRTAEEGEETPMSAEPEPEPTDPSEARQFTTVISGLRSQYPKEKLDEISTSFCFICLLHLANERGLKIQVGEADPAGPWAGKGNMVVDDDDDAGAEEDDLKRIGELTQLQVFRDPNARPAA